MPVVPLNAVAGYPPPPDHAVPADHEDVELAMRFDTRLTAMYQQMNPRVTLGEVTNARLHLHDTCNSFLAANAAPELVINANVLQNALQPFQDEIVRRLRRTIRFETLRIRQEIRQDIRRQTRAIRTEVRAIRTRLDNLSETVQDLNHTVEGQANTLNVLQELAIDTSVTYARNLNCFRNGGLVAPLLAVRLADGRVPVAPRPRLTSLAVINELDFRQATSYAQGYGLLDDLGPEPTIEQLREAIARHVGAIRLEA